MNVLFVSAEAVPFAKVGGMADVIGSLPQALRKLGVDARVIMPGYGLIGHYDYDISLLASFHIPMQQGSADVQVYTTISDGVPFYFLQAWPYFGTEMSVYGDWDWDSPRFIFFNQIIMGVIWEIGERIGWFPDVFHVNDWHTSLLPFMIKENTHLPRWRETASVLSIHNMAYQGDNVGGFLWLAGLPPRRQPDLIYQDLTGNLLATAIAYADVVTTVSPRYAVEIQYPYMGYGLEGLVRTRQDNLRGILNGIDVDLWDPATDKRLVQNYDAGNFREKRGENKRHLQQILGLEVSEDIMLIGIVSRLVWQKGFDLAVPALRRLLENHTVQFVVLGTGEVSIEQQLWSIGQDFYWKARALLQYDDAVAQQIYAGVDLFLMPSRFEPCGIGQMMAMRYGALPLVRETGGLADTVENYDDGPAERGTGFTFAWQESDAIYGTLEWALDTFNNRQTAWQRMQQRAMEKDFSWDNSARQYIEVYEQAIQKRKE